MSTASFIDYKFKKYDNPIVNFDDLSLDNTQWLLSSQPSNVLFQEDNFTTASANNLSINIASIPPNIGLERDIKIKCKLRYTVALEFSSDITALQAAVTAIVNNNVGLRAYPLQSSCTNMTISINGLNFSYQPNLYTDQLQRFNNNNIILNKMSPSISFQDPSAVFDPASPDNPLANFSVNYVSRRNNIVKSVSAPVLSNAGKTATFTIDYEFTESLLYDPFVPRVSNNEPALLQIKNLQLNLTFNNLFSNSICNYFSAQTIVGSTITLVSSTITGGTFIETPKLLTRQYSLPVNSIYQYNMDLPLIYPYNYITVNQSTPNALVLAGGTTTFAYSFNLSYIPSKMYIYCYDASNVIQANPLIPQACFGLVEKSLKITFNQSSNILNNATNDELFRIACNNGFNGSLYQWNNNSIIVLDCAHMNLAANMSAGVMNNINMTVQGTFINSNNILPVSPATGQARTPQLYITYIVPGSIMIKNTSLNVALGLASGEALLDSNTEKVSQMELMVYNNNKMTEALGGAFMPRVRSLVSTSAKLLKKALPYVEEYGPTVYNKAKSLVESLASSGYTEEEIIKYLKDKKAGMALGGKNLGGVRIGGAAVNKDKLSKNLLKY